MFEQKGSWFWYDVGSTTEVKGKPVPIGPEKIANGMENLKLYLASHFEVVERLQKDVAALIKKEETQPVSGAPSV